MVSKVLKVALFSCLVLSLAQIEVNDRRISEHYSDAFDQVVSQMNSDSIGDHWNDLKDEVSTQTSAIKKIVSPEKKKRRSSSKRAKDVTNSNSHKESISDSEKVQLNLLLEKVGRK